MSKKPKLTDISGLGPKTREALAEAGIKTVDKLSKADPVKLAARVDGLGEAQASKFIEAAQKLATPQKTEKKAEKKTPMKTEKKPKKETVKEDKPELTDISGLGPKTREALAEAGIVAVGDLSKADPERLAAEVDGLGEAQASKFIEAAQQLEPVKKKEEPSEKPKKKRKKKATKAKPEIPKRDTLIDQRLLRIAKEKRRRQPSFKHEQAHRWKRVSDSWRKIRGIDSATREKMKGRIAMVSPGYRKPKAVRGLHPSRFVEMPVHRPDDLKSLDPEIHAVRIGSTVGMKKRQEIIRKADTMLLRVLNPGAPEAVDEADLFTDLEELEVD
ncbi:MAG: 50S ribosomal protein L32e [Candidatus Thorarchaeota archaeon]|nr:50S ribosomal protein L32e [Candidatus Thorarchaeota archaeon]